MHKLVTMAIATDNGIVAGVLHPVVGARGGVVIAGDELCGLRIAGSIWEELALYLRAEGLSVVRLEHRNPGDLAACAYDILAAVAVLVERGVEQVVLIGCGAGGAAAGVARQAGDGVAGLGDAIAGVAQVVGPPPGVGPIPATDPARRLQPPHLRLVRDTPEPPGAAGDMLVRANGPDELVIYPGGGHDAERQAVAMLEALWSWTRELLLAVDQGRAPGSRAPVPLMRDRPGAEPAGTTVTGGETGPVVRAVQGRLDARWRAVVEALAVRDPARAAAVRAVGVVEQGGARPVYHQARAAWHHLDTPARQQWLQSIADIWRLSTRHGADASGGDPAARD